MKVVVNRTFGGFKIPKDLVDELGWYCEYFSGFDRPSIMDRTDPKLISALERMIEEGSDINDGDPATKLEILDIPDDVDWYIDDYDGKETIHEDHRIW